MRHSHWPTLFIFSLVSLIYSAQGPAFAQSNSTGDAASSPSPTQQIPMQNRPGLLDGPGSPLESLRQRGIDLTVTYTEFGQGLVAGDGNHSWRLGGKMLGKMTLDGAKLHLWRGFSINLTGELNDGANVNGMGGSVLIQNTALAFPQDVGTGGDLSLNVTQRFGERVSLSIGKFDMINAPSRTPILGGGGLDTFWNIAFAAPPSGVLPPYMTGGNLSISTKPGTFTFMLYDPTNAQQKAGLKGWGTQGITGRVSARFPAKIHNLQGFHTFTFAASSQTGLNLEDIPQLILPPESAQNFKCKSRLLLRELCGSAILPPRQEPAGYRLGTLCPAIDLGLKSESTGWQRPRRAGQHWSLRQASTGPRGHWLLSLLLQRCTQARLLRNNQLQARR